jgi:microcompartment protein CcmK/EutM
MKIARVIGTVTLSRMHPSMQGYKLRCVEVVESADQIQVNQDDAKPIGGDTIVAWDLVGSGQGDWVALAEGPESAAPFRPDVKPTDASIVAILDHCEVQTS